MSEKKKIKFTSLIVALVLIEAAILTGIYVWVFCTYGHVPDTLIVATFGFLGTELGICGGVTMNGNKYDYLNNSIPPQGGVG